MLWSILQLTIFSARRYLNQTVIDETYTIKDTVRPRTSGPAKQQSSNSKHSSSLTNSTQPSSASSVNKTALFWVENSLHIPRLARNYYNSILTCQTLRDHNSFTPKSISLRIDMHRKWIAQFFILTNFHAFPFVCSTPFKRLQTFLLFF